MLFQRRCTPTHTQPYRSFPFWFKFFPPLWKLQFSLKFILFFKSFGMGVGGASKPLGISSDSIQGWARIFSGTVHLQNGMVFGVLVQVLTNGHKWQVEGCTFLQCTEMLHCKLKSRILLCTLPLTLQVVATCCHTEFM